jgi:tetratricopeptide (TPR) repeat protein
LSEKYGFEIIPNADRWNNVNNLRFISGKLLREGRTEEAITVAERWNLYQPQSLAALLTWAQALEKLALDKQALQKYQQLISLAKEQQSERLPEFTLAMENLQKK